MNNCVNCWKLFILTATYKDNQQPSPDKKIRKGSETIERVA